jgi:hypothetical protein
MNKRQVRGAGQGGIEPEIIPPHAPYPFESGQRIYVARVGPMGLLAGLFAVALLALIALLLLLGLFLVAIPVVVLVVAAAMIAGWWKGRSR